MELWYGCGKLIERSHSRSYLELFSTFITRPRDDYTKTFQEHIKEEEFYAAGPGIKSWPKFGVTDKDWGSDIIINVNLFNSDNDIIRSPSL